MESERMLNKYLVLLFIFVSNPLLAQEEITVRGKVVMGFSLIPECECLHPELSPLPGYPVVSLGDNVLDFAHAVMYLDMYVEATGVESTYFCFDFINWLTCNELYAITDISYTVLLSTIQLNSIPPNPSNCQQVTVTVEGFTEQEIQNITTETTVNGNNIWLDIYMETLSGPSESEPFYIDSDMGILDEGVYTVRVNISYYEGGELLFVESEESSLTVSTEISGDMNYDQSLDILDLVITVDCIMNNAGDCPCADVNSDGAVDVMDIVQMVEDILDNSSRIQR